VLKFYNLLNYEKKIDAYFVLSNIQKNLLSEFGTDKNKMFLKPNFIKDLDLHVNSKHKKDYIYVGRLEYQKGVQFLLDFWKMLPRKFVLKVVGLGKLQEEIDESRWPHIKYLGKLEHSEALKEIAKSKYLIQPSLMYETFSLTTIEAMSVGTPVIAFAYGTRKEFVKNEVNGLIADLENFNDVIKMSKGYKEYEKLCQSALDTAKAYEKKSIINKQIGYYEEILNG
jgi:glycosyltransferase involved in cell wall biosynthesis